MIGPAIGPVGTNHSSAGAVRLSDHGGIGNIDPSALETDAVMAILRFPINVADGKTVHERTTKPLAGCKPVEPFVQFRTAGVMGERGRAKQQENQDNSHHDRLPSSQKARLSASRTSHIAARKR